MSLNPISNLPSPATNSASPLATLDAPQLSGLEKQLKSLSLTILGSTGIIEGPGDVKIRLQSPSISPQDIALNQFLEQLNGLEKMPVGPFMLGASVDNLIGGTHVFGKAMQAKPPLDAKQTTELATKLENQAKFVEVNIREIIENSTYPNFSDFLKDLVKVAQSLREAATKAKMASIQASYDAMYEASNQMLEAAEQAKASRDKQIQAERTQAITQIVTGVVEGAIAIGFGAAGASQLGGTVSQISGSLISGTSGLITSDMKSDSSELQLKSDLANVAKQRLEAAAKLIEQQTAIADDLRDIAKGLRDMVLKVYQDFIAAQNEVIQRANV